MPNFLIIGYGSIAKRHLANILSLKKKFNIYILTRQKIKFKKFSNVTFVKDLKFLKNVRVDFVLVCTGSNEHIKYAKIFINKSKKIFIEKPLSDNFKKAFTFLRECKNSKTKIFVGYNIIFLSSLLRLKKILKNEKILKVSTKTSYDLRLWRKKQNYEKSVSAIKSKGGGVLLELSHDLHYLIWMLGKPNWVSSINKKISNLKVDTEDNVSMTIGFRNIIANVELDFINKYYQREISILTKKNFYLWNYKKNFIKKYDIKSDKLKKIFKGKDKISDTYKKELKFFLNSNDKKFFSYLFKLSLITLSLINAAKKSSFSNMKKILIK